MKNANTVPLPAGIAEVVVSNQGFDGRPRRIICSVEHPSGGLVIGATMVEGSFSRDGFRVALTAAPPAAGYRLHYWASVAGVWELEGGGFWETESGEPWDLE